MDITVEYNPREEEVFIKTENQIKVKVNTVIHVYDSDDEMDTGYDEILQVCITTDESGNCLSFSSLVINEGVSHFPKHLFRYKSIYTSSLQSKFAATRLSRSFT